MPGAGVPARRPPGVRRRLKRSFGGSCHRRPSRSEYPKRDDAGRPRIGTQAPPSCQRSRLVNTSSGRRHDVSVRHRGPGRADHADREQSDCDEKTASRHSTASVQVDLGVPPTERSGLILVGNRPQVSAALPLIQCPPNPTLLLAGDLGDQRHPVAVGHNATDDENEKNQECHDHSTGESVGPFTVPVTNVGRVGRDPEIPLTLVAAEPSRPRALPVRRGIDAGVSGRG